MDEVFGKDKAERGLGKRNGAVFSAAAWAVSGRTDLQVSAIRVIVECPS